MSTPLNLVSAQSEIKRPHPGHLPTGLNFFNCSIKFWFVVTFASQIVFASYMAMLYSKAAFLGETSVLHEGAIKETDFWGGVQLMAHLLLGAIITLSGPFQLIPAVRKNYPIFHKWNGRLYFVTAILISLGAIYLILTRGSTVSTVMIIGVVMNGLLILLCTILSWYYAVQKKIEIHRTWALRLFLVVGGTLYFRVIFILWMALTNGVGHNESFTGPFDLFMGYGNYLIPLFILELYLRAEKSTKPKVRIAMGITLIVLSLAMLVGTTMTALFMWIPKI